MIAKSQTIARKIPVIILTGFLGSGKTSFLNRLIKLSTFRDSAIIINEFGEVSLDHHLIETPEDEIVELANGCVCCTVRGALSDALAKMAARNPGSILIETTGLADPLPVAQSVIAQAGTAVDDASAIELSGIWTLVDGEQGADTIANHGEAARQVSLADALIITKTDLLNGAEKAAQLGTIETLLRKRNRAATIDTADSFLSESAGRGQRTQSTSVPSRSPSGFTATADNAGTRHGAITAITLTADEPVTRAAIDMFCDLLLSAHGNHIPRMKGLVAIAGETRPLLVQSAGSRLSEPVLLDAWPHEDRRTAVTVFLDGIEARFVQALFDGFTGQTRPDTPDQSALSDNPLSIGGMKLG